MEKAGTGTQRVTDAYHWINKTNLNELLTNKTNIKKRRRH